MGGSGSEELKKCHPPSSAILRFVDEKKIYDWYQRWLASMVYRFFDLKTGSGAGPNVKDLAQELHKPVIKEF